MDKREERHFLHETRVALAAATIRDPLWAELGLAQPLKPESLWEWVASLWSKQQITGERLVLTLPPPAPFVAEVPPARERIPFVSFLDDLFYVHAFAGVYLTDYTAAWPREGRWERWGWHEAKDIQPLALVALAATSVEEVVGCTPLDATMFLLCDSPLHSPGVRVSISGWSGAHLWSEDLVPADEIRDAYMSARRSLGIRPRHRTKELQSHPWELIALVRRMRPHSGRHPDNAPWTEVLDAWNERHPESRYDGGVRSIQEAYRAAVKRRVERMELGSVFRGCEVLPLLGEACDERS